MYVRPAAACKGCMLLYHHVRHTTQAMWVTWRMRAEEIRGVYGPFPGTVHIIIVGQNKYFVLIKIFPGDKTAPTYVKRHPTWHENKILQEKLLLGFFAGSNTIASPISRCREEIVAYPSISLVRLPMICFGRVSEGRRHFPPSSALPRECFFFFFSLFPHCTKNIFTSRIIPPKRITAL